MILPSVVRITWILVGCAKGVDVLEEVPEDPTLALPPASGVMPFMVMAVVEGPAFPGTAALTRPVLAKVTPLERTAFWILDGATTRRIPPLGDPATVTLLCVPGTDFWTKIT